MSRFSVDLLASPRRWAKFVTGRQRVIECDLHDSSLVVEQLRAQGWDTEEVAAEDGRAVIQLQRSDFASDDAEAMRAALQESGLDVNIR